MTAPIYNTVRIYSVIVTVYPKKTSVHAIRLLKAAMFNLSNTIQMLINKNGCNRAAGYNVCSASLYCPSSALLISC